MPVEVVLPKVDMDMTHGTLATWHVAPGEAVTKGAPLFDIETDKAAMEVEAPATGRLHAVTAQPGDKVAVGTVVALIYAEGEDVAATAATPSAPTSDAFAPAVGTRSGAVEVILPKVDMDMSHGTLATWHSAEGDSVTKGAPLFDIETDKAAMEVEAPATGILHHIRARPGQSVAVGSVVALIYPPGVAVGPPPSPAPPPSPVPPPAAAASADVPPRTPEIPLPEVPSVRARRATPAARAEARKAGVDLAEVPGTGPRGRVQRDDVTAFAESPVQSAMPPAPVRWRPQQGQLHVSRRKGTGTPLVLLHGFAADNQSWAPLEKGLGADRPLIRIDLPGHGRSPRRHVSRFADLARMVVDAFDEATRDDGEVHLLGHSLGGALALSLTDIRPRRIAALALIAPAGFGPEIDAPALNGIARATRTESLAPWLRRLVASPEAISDDYVKAVMKSRADPELRAFQTDLAANLFPDGVQAFDMRPALSRLVCPTTLIWGRNDHILPWRQAISAIGDFALHLLADAGHVPQIEHPARVARILGHHFAGASTGS